MTELEPLAAWATLERSHTGETGTYSLRILAESGHDLFAVLELPSGKVGFRLEVDSASVPALRPFPTTVAFRSGTERAGSRTRLTLLLEHTDFKGVFGEMAVDVLRWTVSAPDSTSAVREFARRLETWKDLFRGGGPLPLNDDQQAGLFGELSLILKLLDAEVGPDAAIDAWRGPFRDPHDFHFGEVHVEVKASAMQAHSVEISDLRQLGSEGLSALFLWHFELTSTDAGTTLWQLCRSLKDRLGPPGSKAAYRFSDRLLRCGFLEEHRAHYDHVPLAVSGERVLRVSAGFPALTHASVPPAITEARYTLDLRQVPAEYDHGSSTAVSMVKAAITQGAE